MASAKSSWTCCPFGTFAAFQARYAKQMDLTGDGAFTLELDLARPGAARDAYYGASMICAVLRREPTAWRACIELRKTTAGRPGQASLFASVET